MNPDAEPPNILGVPLSSTPKGLHCIIGVFVILISSDFKYQIFIDHSPIPNPTLWRSKTQKFSKESFRMVIPAVMNRADSLEEAIQEVEKLIIPPLKNLLIAFDRIREL